MEYPPKQPITASWFAWRTIHTDRASKHKNIDPTGCDEQHRDTTDDEQKRKAGTQAKTMRNKTNIQGTNQSIGASKCENTDPTDCDGQQEGTANDGPDVCTPNCAKYVWTECRQQTATTKLPAEQTPEAYTSRRALRIDDMCA